MVRTDSRFRFLAALSWMCILCSTAIKSLCTLTVTVIVFADYNIDCDHLHLIQKNFNLLLNEVNPRDSGLIGDLFSREIIDLREKEFVEAGEGAVCVMERLLSVVSRKSTDEFDLFLDVLVETGHEHVVRLIREEASEG